MVVDKEQKMALVIDVAVPVDSDIRKKEHEKIKKYQGLKEQLKQMWKVKCNEIPVVVGALGAVTPKLREWLQQIPGTTSEVSSRKPQSQKQLKYCTEGSHSQASGRGPELEKDIPSHVPCNGCEGSKYTKHCRLTASMVPASTYLGSTKVFLCAVCMFSQSLSHSQKTCSLGLGSSVILN